MNINWKTVEMEDKEIISGYYKEEQSRSCEETFANNYLWEPHYHVRYAVIEDMLVFISGEDNEFSLGFPHGKGDLKKVILLLCDYFKQNNNPFTMHLVTAEQFNRLEEAFPNQFQIAYDRDAADYIYEAEKLVTLAGKKLHAKRNHINKFKLEHQQWQYEVITKENKEECFQMAAEWCKVNGCNDDPEKKMEFCVTLNALKFMEELELKGGLLRVDGKIAAFSLGEAVSSDTFVVHIEKAFADIQGAYPMINQQFVLHEAEGYTYINREEDMGAEGLRKAKLSYYPIFLQEKGMVTKK